MTKKILLLLLATLLFLGKTTFAMVGADAPNADGIALADEHEVDDADAANVAAGDEAREDNHAWDDQVDDEIIVDWAKKGNTRALDGELQKAAAKLSTTRVAGAITSFEKMRILLAVLKQTVHIRAIWYEETSKAHPLERKRSWLFWKNPWFIGKQTEPASITTIGNTIAEKIETPLRKAIDQIHSETIGIEREAGLNNTLKEFGFNALQTRCQHIKAIFCKIAWFMCIVTPFLIASDRFFQGSIIQTRFFHYECGMLYALTYEMLAQAYNCSQSFLVAYLSIPLKWLYSWRFIKNCTDYIGSKAYKLGHWVTNSLVVPKTTCTAMTDAARNATRKALQTECEKLCNAETDGILTKTYTICTSLCARLFGK